MLKLNNISNRREHTRKKNKTYGPIFGLKYYTHLIQRTCAKLSLSSGKCFYIFKCGIKTTSKRLHGTNQIIAKICM